MTISVILFPNIFLEIVTITFTALIVTEYLNILTQVFKLIFLK